MGYQLKLHKSVIKFLKSASPKFRFRIVEKINLLQENPINHPQLDIKVMQGFPDIYHLRMGQFRIIYQVQQDNLIIYLLTIGSRGDVYK